MLLRSKVSNYAPPPSECVLTFNTVRKKRILPIYDSNGKQISEREEFYLERIVVRDEPNLGLHYEDFDVENSQRLGIALSHVPTGGNPLSFSEKKAAEDYLNSPELEQQFIAAPESEKSE